MTTRVASCCCGGLTAICEGEPGRVSVCHCTECQRRTGSAFGVQARFDADQVRIEGPRSHFTRTGDEGMHATFAFCPTCGATVAWTIAEAPGVVAVAVGAFADQDFPAPVTGVYEERAKPWVTVSGLKVHE